MNRDVFCVACGAPTPEGTHICANCRKISKEDNNMNRATRRAKSGKSKVSELSKEMTLIEKRAGMEATEAAVRKYSVITATVLKNNGVDPVTIQTTMVQILDVFSQVNKGEMNLDQMEFELEQFFEAATPKKEE